MLPAHPARLHEGSARKVSRTRAAVASGSPSAYGGSWRCGIPAVMFGMRATAMSRNMSDVVVRAEAALVRVMDAATRTRSSRVLVRARGRPLGRTHGPGSMGRRSWTVPGVKSSSILGIFNRALYLRRRPPTALKVGATQCLPDDLHVHCANRADRGMGSQVELEGEAIVVITALLATEPYLHFRI